MNGDWNVKADHDLSRRLQNQMQDIKVPPQPPLGMLERSVDGLRTISTRLNGLADQLSGIEPEKAGEGGAVLSGGGVFGDIERLAREIDDLAGTMSRHLSRIERRL